MRIITVLLALACGALAAPVDDDEALQEFITGNLRFSSAVYRELLKKETGNFIFSPLSVETVLALSNEGAEGETSSEFYTALALPSTKDKTQRALKSLLPKLKKSDDDLKLLSANKIYIGKGVALEDTFKNIATNIYGAGVDNVDFAKNIEASDTINGWVEDQTNHKIRNLINPALINQYTKMVLINALYFNGKWVSKFNDDATRKKKFFKTKSVSVEVDTMHQFKHHNYYESKTLNAKFLELPYKGDNVSMVIVLPNEKEGLSSLEENIDQVLQPQPFSTELVDVEFPKFTVETTIQFAPILKNLGLKKAFEEKNDGGFSGISSNYKNLSIKDVIQKAFINVTEAGTEAAAATGVVFAVPVSAYIPPPPKIYDVHADHPFLYFIKFNGVALVVGRYVDPAV